MTTPIAPPVIDPLAQYTEAKWRSAVKRGETTQGYTEWRLSKRREDRVEYALMQLSDRDTSVILAALRYWQIQPGVPVRFSNIATDEGKHAAMSSAEVDELAERINLMDKSYRVGGYLLRHDDGKVATIVRHKPSDRCKLKVTKLVEVES